jgi:hypothetical protein
MACMMLVNHQHLSRNGEDGKPEFGGRPLRHCDSWLPTDALGCPAVPAGARKSTATRDRSARLICFLLKEDADVFGRQHVLVGDQFAMGDPPHPVNPPQHVPSCADVEIVLGLRAAPVNDEIGVDLEFGFCVGWLDPDIDEQVAGARREGPPPMPCRCPAAQRAR